MAAWRTIPHIYCQCAAWTRSCKCLQKPVTACSRVLATPLTCVNCPAAIIRPEHATWHLLCSLGCQCPTHMVIWGLLMLTHLMKDKVWEVNHSSETFLLWDNEFCQQYLFLICSSDQPVVLPTTFSTVPFKPKEEVREVLSSEFPYETTGKC